MEDFHSAPVEAVQDIIAYSVFSPVFGSVCQIGAVRSDACQAQGPGASCLFAFLFPPLLTGFDEYLNRAGDQLLRLFTRVPVCGQPRDGRLIAAGYSAVRSGTEVIQVYPADKLRGLRQGPGGPEL